MTLSAAAAACRAASDAAALRRALEGFAADGGDLAALAREFAAQSRDQDQNQDRGQDAQADPPGFADPALAALARLAAARGVDAALAPLLALDGRDGAPRDADIDAVRAFAAEKLRSPMDVDATEQALDVMQALAVWAEPDLAPLTQSQPDRPYPLIVALDCADTLQIRASILAESPAFERAVAAYDAVLVDLEAARGDEIPRMRRIALANFGNLLSSYGRTVSDFDQIRRAVEINTRLISGLNDDDHPFRANVLLNRSSAELTLAGQSGRRADYEAALATVRAAIDDYQRHDDPHGVARSRNNICLIYSNMAELSGDAADFEAGLAAVEAGVAQIDRAAAPREWLRLMTNRVAALNRYGEAFADIDRLHESVSVAGEALDALANLDHPLAVANLLSLRANALRSLAELTRSPAFARRSIDDARRVSEMEEPGGFQWARAEMALSSSERALGEIEDQPETIAAAVLRARAAAEVFEAVGNRGLLAKCRANLALALLERVDHDDRPAEIERADLEAARALVEAALASFDPDEEDFLWARMRLLLARIHRGAARRLSGTARGQAFQTAAELYRAALPKLADGIGYRVETQALLGLTLFERDDPDDRAEAEKLLDDALDSTAEAVFSAPAEDSRRNLIASLNGAGDALAFLRAERGDLLGALHAVAKGRAVLGAAAIALRRLEAQDGLGDALRAARSERFAAERRLEALRAAAPGVEGQDAARLAEQTAAAKARRDAAHAALEAALDSAGLSLRPQPPELDELTAALPQGGVLATILVTARSGGFLLAPRPTDPRTPADLAFAPAPALTADAVARLWRDWARGVRAFAEAGLFPTRRALADWNARIERACEAVGALAMSPLSQALALRLDQEQTGEGGGGEVRDVALVAPGAFATMPLAAAYAAAPSRAGAGARRARFLDHWRLSFVPSFSVLSGLRAHSVHAAAPRLLALNGLTDAVDAATPPDGAANPAWSAFAPDERRQVAPDLSAERVGPAVEAALAEAPDRPAVLSVFSHGLWTAGEPDRSGVMLADGSLWRMPEIGALDLGAVRLAILGACETARIEEGCAPDEQVGLAHAFLAAGAGGVVSSLWRVDRAQTFALIADLARGLADDLSPAEALRQAQLRRLDPAPDAPRATAAPGWAAIADADRAELLGIGGPPVAAAPNKQSEDPAPLPADAPFFWAAFTLVGG